MSKVLNRKQIEITKAITKATNSFDTYIYVEFDPDEVILRGITYDMTMADAGVIYSLSSNLVSGFMASFLGDVSTSRTPRATFIMGKPVSSSFNFVINNVNAGTGNLSLQLEFIKYK